MLVVLLTWSDALVRLLHRLERPPHKRFLSSFAFALCLGLRAPERGYRRIDPPHANAVHAHFRRKPEWVRKEIIRLKALMREAGTCRAIESAFNHLYAYRRKMTVGRTFVSGVIRKHRHEIEVLSRKLKNAKPWPVPKNLVWAIDLTGKATLDGRTQIVLGLLEHASRTALLLEALQTKSSWNLVSKLTGAIRRYGKPGILRTDNEACFTSKTFRFVLWLLGIRHQRTAPGCPWMNGKVERFFGTLKQKLDRLAVDSLDALGEALVSFRFFYNHVRVHQNLDGRTPAQAWAGVDPCTTKIKEQFWFEAWDRLLCGYYLKR